MTDAHEVEQKMHAEIDDMVSEVRENIDKMGRKRALSGLSSVIELLMQINPKSVAMMMTVVIARLADATRANPQPQVQVMELDKGFFTTVQESAKEMIDGMCREITDEMARGTDETTVAMDITAVNMN